MPQPDIGSFAQRIYDQLEPLAERDELFEWALAHFVGSMGINMFQEIEDLAGDGDNGEVGWSQLIDIDRAPRKALPWLAQFEGLEIPDGLTEEQERQYLHDAAAWFRGTKNGMIAAIKPTLTGQQSVLFRERVGGDAYALTVSTYTSETPNPAQTEAVLREKQKPAGIILTYQVLDGQDYQALKDNYATYQDVKDAYTTYEDVRADTP